VGRHQQISKERVVDAALGILDTDGVTGLSLSRIAREVGARGPSLYYHYADKAAILDAVAARVIGDLDIRRPVDDWVEWLVGNAIGFHDRVMAHPNVASLLMEHLSPRGATAAFAHGARLLSAAGVDASLQVPLLEGVQHLAWGFTLHRAMRATDTSPVADGDNARWPELVRAQRADRWKHDHVALERSVRAFIDGVLTTPDA
jgi:TetR/AcrR family transcriptional regulator, tetracycline repressor protein